MFEVAHSFLTSSMWQVRVGLGWVRNVSVGWRSTVSVSHSPTQTQTLAAVPTPWEPEGRSLSIHSWLYCTQLRSAVVSWLVGSHENLPQGEIFIMCDPEIRSDVVSHLLLKLWSERNIDPHRITHHGSLGGRFQKEVSGFIGKVLYAFLPPAAWKAKIPLVQ